MINRLILLVLALFTTLVHARATDAEAGIGRRVGELLARMTVEEKVGQLSQFSSRGEVTGPVTQTQILPRLQSGGVGSLLNVRGAAMTREMQEIAVKGSRHGIPLLFAMDVIHGYRTIFPIPLATAASWDLEAIERAERVAAIEASAVGLHWTFAPMIDVSRDPRWGRIAEGAGEDTYLNAVVARARVRGFQTANLGAPGTIMACAKHFAAYGAAQAGRDYFTTDVTERTLREVYFPPFQAALEEGVATFMTGFNDLDGVPCTGNEFLLRRVLREEWGFKGFVVSDWASVAEMRSHGNVGTLREASVVAMNAGVDMDMEGYGYEKHLTALVKSGVVPMERLDEAAGAILAAKFRLGLFEDPYRYSDEAAEARWVGAPEHRAIAHEVTRRTAVLLKNSGVLPLAKGTGTVALVGPLADNARDQLGCWAAAGVPEEAVTLRAALEEVFPGGRLRYAAGCATTGDDTAGIAAAVEAARGADVVVVALGEAADQSGEAMSRASLAFSGPQMALLQAVRATGKPVVLVVMAGRPLLLVEAEPLVDAILVGWHPGTMGGPALADVLTGAWNPSGKLPLSWPRAEGQIPLFYAHKNTGRPGAKKQEDRYYSRYIDLPNTPHYPFGFGLSYTTFAIDRLELWGDRKLRLDGPALRVSARVRNTGAVAGEEVVQLYVRDRVGSVTRPVRELKGFHKVMLAPGEERVVEFALGAADLAFWRADGKFAAEPGEFDVFVGADANAALTARFRLE